MEMMFFATVEFLSGQSAAIVTITDRAGEWAGSGRIEVRSGHRSDLYEAAYRHAALSVHGKGGRLERFSVVAAVEEPPLTWEQRQDTCGSRVWPAFLHRRANALNVEPMQPSGRCLNRRPEHWPASMSALRWRGSGGDALVFGRCEASHCPECVV